MRLSNESPLARIPTPVLVGVWLLAIVVTAGCLIWALLAPWGNESDQTIQVTAAPTKLAKATVTPARTLRPGSTPTRVAPAPTSDSAVPQPTQGAAPQTTATPGATVKPTSPPKPTATPTTLPINETFGYGIQVNGLNDFEAPERSIDMVNKLKMTWIKQQVRWEEFEKSPGQFSEPDIVYLDDLVQRANQSRIKVMLSIVTAPKWAHPSIDSPYAPPDDPNTYANFVGRLIDRYKSKRLAIHAIEVWNEQNLSREWVTNPQKIEARRYMQMLSTSYKVIKSKDPNIIVISGALSPTGVDNGVDAVDDFNYLKQMVSFDLLNNADCIGVHHNGINLPPDVPYQDAPKHPKAAKASYRGPFSNPHHSWSFYTTLHESAQIVNRQKPLCITEFGWPSAEGVTTPIETGFAFANDNSLQDQADYIVKAFQLMREWGFVKIAFLWNLNFNGAEDPRNWNNVPYSILDSNGVPRPAFDALERMPKP